jgi:hypothetical protein
VDRAGNNANADAGWFDPLLMFMAIKLHAGPSIKESGRRIVIEQPRRRMVGQREVLDAVLTLECTLELAKYHAHLPVVILGARQEG